MTISAFLLNWLLLLMIQPIAGYTNVEYLHTGTRITHSMNTKTIRRQVREYNFTITREYISPDGYNKGSLLVNGIFSGPSIEADYSDILKVTVNNRITRPEEGTTIHWHGMLQTGTPYYDGVAAVTQCPIAPGKSMTYTFTADNFGTSCYHTHFSSQYVDGIFGPITITG